MKKESLFEKIKGSIKAASFIFLLLVAFVLMVFGLITPGQWLSYTVAIATSFWGIREYGKQFRSQINISDQND